MPKISGFILRWKPEWDEVVRGFVLTDAKHKLLWKVGISSGCFDSLPACLREPRLLSKRRYALLNGIPSGTPMRGSQYRYAKRRRNLYKNVIGKLNIRNERKNQDLIDVRSAVNDLLYNIITKS